MSEEKPQEYKVGNIVRLRSGGPDMVIVQEDAREPRWHARWWDGHRFAETWFATASLVPVAPGADSTVSAAEQHMRERIAKLERQLAEARGAPMSQWIVDTLQTLTSCMQSMANAAERMETAASVYIDHHT